MIDLYYDFSYDDLFSKGIFVEYPISRYDRLDYNYFLTLQTEDIFIDSFEEWQLTYRVSGYDKMDYNFDITLQTLDIYIDNLDEWQLSYRVSILYKLDPTLTKIEFFRFDSGSDRNVRFYRFDDGETAKIKILRDWGRVVEMRIIKPSQTIRELESENLITPFAFWLEKMGKRD